MAPGPHRAPLQRLDVPASSLEPLEAYLDTLAAWSARINLTGARTPEERVDLLVAPARAAAELPGPGRLLDLGSGSGSPGLVLALLRPDLAVTLLEPRARRWAFLREAARAAARPDVEVLRARHDAYAGASAETVTLRALALPLADLVPLVRPGGRLLVFGGEPGREPPELRRETGQPLGQGCLHVYRRG
jgi:16S rRNA (guanine527-N7)-methyltransferase